MFKHIWCIPPGRRPLGEMCSWMGTDGGRSRVVLEYISTEDDVAFSSVSRLTLTATQSRYLNHIKTLLFMACLVILSGFLKNICQPPCGDYDELTVRLFIFAKMNSAPLSEVLCPKKLHKWIIIKCKQLQLDQSLMKRSLFISHLKYSLTLLCWPNFWGGMRRHVAQAPAWEKLTQCELGLCVWLAQGLHKQTPVLASSLSWKCSPSNPRLQASDTTIISPTVTTMLLFYRQQTAVTRINSDATDFTNTPHKDTTSLDPRTYELTPGSQCIRPCSG